MTTADLQFLRAHPCVRFVSDRTRKPATDGIGCSLAAERFRRRLVSMSLSAVRKIRLRVAAVAAGCDQASSRSAPSCISCWRSRSPSGRGLPRDDSSDLAFYYVHGLQCLVPAAPNFATGNSRDRQRRIADGHARPRNAPVEATGLRYGLGLTPALCWTSKSPYPTFSVSSAMSLPKSADVTDMVSTPKSASRVITGDRQDLH